MTVSTVVMYFVRKVAKGNISFVTSVRPSVRLSVCLSALMEQFGLPLNGFFMKFKNRASYIQDARLLKVKG